MIFFYHDGDGDNGGDGGDNDNGVDDDKGERGKGCGVRNQHSDWKRRYLALLRPEVVHLLKDDRDLIIIAMMMMTMEVSLPCFLPCRGFSYL